MKTSDFDYKLAEELIAQFPADKRDKSRLMIVGKKTEHKLFSDIIDYLQKDDVFVLNETKVIKSKLVGKKTTGSDAEIILLKRIDNKNFVSRVKTKNPNIGTEMIFNMSEISKNEISEHDQEVVSKTILDNYKCKIIKQETDIFTIEFDKELTDDVIDKIAILPTPPYIKEKMDYSRYQTVYAQKEGSVAAPTAGLHFTEELLEKIKQKGVKIAKLTLHIGFGTFIPIRTLNIEQHKMEEEYFEIDEENKNLINNCKGRLVCVGTTSLRALEAMSKNGKIVKDKGIADLFIYPGYKFQSNVEILITNFHLPKSTLLLLVSALAGTETIKKVYQEAIKEKYRFYSFGDAMVLFKSNL